MISQESAGTFICSIQTDAACVLIMARLRYCMDGWLLVRGSSRDTVFPRI